METILAYSDNLLLRLLVLLLAVLQAYTSLLSDLGHCRCWLYSLTTLTLTTWTSAACSHFLSRCLAFRPGLSMLSAPQSHAFYLYDLNSYWFQFYSFSLPCLPTWALRYNLGHRSSGTVIPMGLFQDGIVRMLSLHCTPT